MSQKENSYFWKKIQNCLNSTIWNPVSTLPLRKLLKPWTLLFKKDIITAKSASQLKCSKNAKNWVLTCKGKISSWIVQCRPKTHFPMALFCIVHWGLISSTPLNCIIQIWKLGYVWSKPDLIITWFVTSPKLALELLIVHFTLVALLWSMIATKTEWTCLHILPWSKTSWRLWQRRLSFLPDSQFSQQNNFNEALVCRITIAINKKFAFTGSYTERSFWYQKFELRKIRTLRGIQSIVDFVAADNCCFFVTTMKAMHFQEDFPQFRLINSKTTIYLCLIWLRCKMLLKIDLTGILLDNHWDWS